VSFCKSVVGEPSNAQCQVKLVTSARINHQIRLALGCTHQRVDTLAATKATPFLLCPALAATLPNP